MKTWHKLLLVLIIAAVVGTLARMKWPEEKVQPEKKSSITACVVVDNGCE